MSKPTRPNRGMDFAAIRKEALTCIRQAEMGIGTHPRAGEPNWEARARHLASYLPAEFALHADAWDRLNRWKAEEAAAHETAVSVNIRKAA